MKPSVHRATARERSGISQRLKALLFLALTIAHPAGAFARRGGAWAYYAQALDEEKARDYRDAILDFHRALKKNHAFVKAHQQLGNCWYYLGDYGQAIGEYDRYLEARPDDRATARFADRLRARLDSGKPVRDRGERKNAAPPLRGTFYAGASLGLILLNGSDLQAFPGNAGAANSYDFGAMEDAHLGYLWASGFGLEAGLGYLTRNALFTNVNGGPDSLLIAEFEGYVEPLVRFPLGPRSALIAGLNVGEAGALVTEANYSNGAATGAGLTFAPELRYQFLFGGRFGLELGALYRVANFGPMSSNGNVIPNGNGPGDWTLRDTGLALRVGINVYFKRLSPRGKRAESY